MGHGTKSQWVALGEEVSMLDAVGRMTDKDHIVLPEVE